MAAYSALLSLAQTTDLTTAIRISLFSTDAKAKIRSIHEYVDFLLSFLDKFPEKIYRWEREIRDVSYEAEDIIDLFIWQKMQLRFLRMNPSSAELEDLLEDVTQKLGSIAEAMLEERPAAISSSSSILESAAASSSSSSSSFAPTGNDAVNGLDDDLMAVKDRLYGKSSKLRVIPIVGMGGIGKTTLAKTVYDDPFIMRHFDIRVWLKISQDYTPQRFRSILLGLLDSMNLLREKMSGHEVDESEIALRVFQNLKGRRYLVVMDDLWGTQVWDNVRNIFPNDNNGSRIKLTPRMLDVAAYPDSGSPLHEMRFMNESQSWDLLKQKVFTSSNCLAKLERVGKEIARRCLVVLVAGLLSAVKNTRASWGKIAKTLNLVVGRESDEILSLSYTHLPHHLRPCFLFFGGFAEDADISASRLMKLWVAEGFLKPQNGCSELLELKAEEYLEDLVKRNLVLVTSRKMIGKIKRCSLHDMVHDLCKRKAQEEKFLHVLPQDMIDEPRRISLTRGVDYICGLNIRTVLGFQLWRFPSWPAFLGRFRLLRVLDVLSVQYVELPSQVFELFLLRYLALTYSFKIPSAISNLINLQTLIIGPAFRSRREYKYVSHFVLPMEIWRMMQLRHLVLYDLYMLPHPPYGSHLPLENLQTLSPIENLVWDSNTVHMIPNLKKLRLVYHIDEEYNLHRLNYLHHLENLKVNGLKGFSWWRRNPSFPRTLKKLTLVGGRFPSADMGIIGSLPHLQILKLLDKAIDGETWKTTDGQFPQLIYLLIDGSHIRHWITQSSSFPRLKCLVLRLFPILEKIPDCIGKIPTLELIEVDDVNDSLVDSAKKINEDQHSYGNYQLQVRVVQRSYERARDWI